MPLKTGSKAPDFTLKSKNAQGLTDITLSKNFGKKNTVLLFFPLAFTGVCTSEMCDVTASLKQYTDLNAEVIGVSVDSPFAQEAWAQKEKIGFPLASDLNKKTAEAYGTLLPDLLGLGSVSGRAVFVIDKTGSSNIANKPPPPRNSPISTPFAKRFPA